MDKETLYNEYKVNRLAIYKIAQKYSIPEYKVGQLLKSFGITINRKIAHNKINIPDKEILEKLYLEENKSFLEIGKILGVSNVTIRQWCKQYNISLRTHKENMGIQMQKYTISKDKYIDNANIKHNNKYDYSKAEFNSGRNNGQKIEIVCPIHGSFWQRPMNHSSCGDGCPVCGHIISSGEIEICKFLDSLKIEYIKSYRNITPTSKYEIDIFVPEFNIGIEYDGIKWHSDEYKDKNYHIDKTKLCLDNGIRLIHIFEDEWKLKSNIWKSMLAYIFNTIKTGIGARYCEVIELSTIEEKEFLNNNHLQGYVSSKVCLGLKYDNKIVSLMSFGKSRFSNKGEYELLRFCNLTNYKISGAASKLFKYFITHYDTINSIVSYSDKRWSIGNLYNQLGFIYSHTSKPNYWYYKSNSIGRESRMAYQKHKLKNKLKVFDINKTEYENMCSNGYLRIFDCGNDVWIWNREIKKEEK